MDLIGPRPELAKNVETLCQEIHFSGLRYGPPGLRGGPRSGNPNPA